MAMLRAEILSDKQKDILIFCYRHHLEHHSFPTMKDIAKHFGFKSQNASHEHIKFLEKKGFVEKHKNRWKFC
jgi:repressor LexA